MKKNNKEVIKLVKVCNMNSPRSNREVCNQFEIDTPDGTYFQSYRSIIAFRGSGKIYLDVNKWDYSVTTGKYRNIFLGESKKETEKKIKEGIYILIDLNKN